MFFAVFFFYNLNLETVMKQRISQDNDLPKLISDPNNNVGLYAISSPTLYRIKGTIPLEYYLPLKSSSPDVSSLNRNYLCTYLLTVNFVHIEHQRKIRDLSKKNLGLNRIMTSYDLF